MDGSKWMGLMVPYLSSNRSSGWPGEVMVSGVLTLAYGASRLTVNGEAEVSEGPV